MEKQQLQLDNLYQQYLKTIFSDKALVEQMESFGFSSPLLIDMNVKQGMIAEKKYKLLLVGQQTKGWGSKIKSSDLETDSLDISNYIDHLKQHYINFNFGKRLDGKTYRGYFWQFQQKLLKRINQSLSDNFGLLWTNIIRLDEKGGKIKDERLLKKIAYNNNEILLNEIAIIKPDVVVFATGYGYDKFLKMTFPDLKIISSSNEDLLKKELAMLESENLPKLSFRTYHPKPLYLNCSEVRKPIIDSIIYAITKELN